MGVPSADSTGAAATPAIRLVPIRPVRIPGATFALGDTLEGLVVRLGLSPDASSAPDPNERVFAGDIPYFGQDARAKLHFTERWLSRAEIQTGSLTEGVRRYIVDEFLRQGYRRSCTRFDAIKVDCDWSGRTFVKMELDSGGVNVDVTLPEELSSVHAAPPPVSVAATATIDPVPSEPETLTTSEANAVTKVPPEYPAMAREANVDGTVHVLAFVDSAGAVRKTKVVRSDTSMLNDAALAAVRQWKFAPHLRGGRPVSFWVEIPVKFSLR